MNLDRAVQCRRGPEFGSGYGCGGSGVSVDPVPTDLGRVLRAVLTDLGPLAAAADVALVPSGIRSIRVFGDAARLTEVVDSLVRNAVKFSRAGDDTLLQATAAR